MKTDPKKISLASILGIAIAISVVGCTVQPADHDTVINPPANKTTVVNPPAEKTTIVNPPPENKTTIVNPPGGGR